LYHHALRFFVDFNFESSVFGTVTVIPPRRGPGFSRRPGRNFIRG